MARLVTLHPQDAVAWSNLAASRFWLGDLPGAIVAIRTSLHLNPGDLLANVNLGAFLLTAGDIAGYEAQLAEVRALVESGTASAWERSWVVRTYPEALRAAAAVPGADVGAVERLRADLKALLCEPDWVDCLEADL